MTIEQLIKCCPTASPKVLAKFCPFLMAGFEETNMIGNPFRMAAFLAQALKESNQLLVLRENLFYKTEARLIEIFGKYMDGKNPKVYLGNPKSLANLVYANRMGNGNESSGDGFMYRAGVFFT